MYILQNQQMKANGSDAVFLPLADPLVQVTVGISYFQLEFQDGADHWIQNIALYLKAEAPPFAQRIQVNSTACLTDASGNSLSPGASVVTVGCIAQLGAQDKTALG